MNWLQKFPAAETPSSTEFMYPLEVDVTKVHDDRADDTHAKRVCVVPLNMPCPKAVSSKDADDTIKRSCSGTCCAVVKLAARNLYSLDFPTPTSALMKESASFALLEIDAVEMVPVAEAVGVYALR